VGLNVEMFANLVGVGRMHIANHDFVNKVRAGRLQELAPFNKSLHLAEAMALPSSRDSSRSRTRKAAG